MLARFQEVPTALRNIIARLERGFADFAQIPYEDSLAQRELLLLLDEFAAECDPDHPASTDYAPQYASRPTDKRGPPNAVRVQTLDHVVYLSGAVSEGSAAS
jgi:hypothetical protein